MNEELKKSRKKVYQKKYREKLKQENLDRLRVIEQYKSKISQISMYKSLITQRTLLLPSRNIHLRSLILELYCHYFEYGVDPHQISGYERQHSFLNFNCSRNCIIESSGVQSPCVAAILEQGKRYHLLFNNYHSHLTSVRRRDPDGDIFTMTRTIGLTLSYSSIANVFPHMLHDHVFLQKAVGKRLIIPMNVSVTFGADNKMQFLVVESQMALAWAVLLEDPLLVARVLGQSQVLSQGNYIKGNYEDLVEGALHNQVGIDG